MKRTTVPLILILLLSPLPGAGLDLYVPALVKIAYTLHASATMTKLTIPLYLLGYGVGLLGFGTYSDYTDRWRLLAWGIVGYTVASLLAALSPSIILLLLFRLLQGFAISIIGVIFKTMQTDFYEPDQVSRVVTSSGTAWGLGVIVSPFLGGYLTHYLGWRSCFYFLVIYSCFCLAFQVLFLPKKFNSPHPFKREMMVNNFRRIFRHGRFFLLIGAVGVTYGAIAVFNVLGPFIIQHNLHYNAKFYGIIALLLGGCFFTGSLINRYLIRHFTGHQIIRFMLPLQVLVVIVMCVISLFDGNSLLGVVIPQMFIYFFISFMMIIPLGECMKIFPDIAGSANAIMNSGYIIIAMAVTILASVFESHSSLPLSLLNLLLTIVFACVIWKPAKDKDRSETAR